MTDNTRATLAAGYGDGRSRTRTERRAALFEPNTEYDELLALQKTDPDRWARLPLATRLGLGYYASDMQAAADHVAGRNDNTEENR